MAIVALNYIECMDIVVADVVVIVIANIQSHLFDSLCIFGYFVMNVGDGNYFH